MACRVDDRPIMKTVGQFLTDCGARLAPFERRRVGRIGCAAALGAILVACGALAAGLWDTGGSWAAGFRFAVLTALTAVIVLYVGMAIVETFVERSVVQSMRGYVSESNTDMDTLLKAAEMRAGSIPGGERLLALLKRKTRGPLTTTPSNTPTRRLARVRKRKMPPTAVKRSPSSGSWSAGYSGPQVADMSPRETAPRKRLVPDTFTPVGGIF